MGSLRELRGRYHYRSIAPRSYWKEFGASEVTVCLEAGTYREAQTMKKILDVATIGLYDKKPSREAVKKFLIDIVKADRATLVKNMLRGTSQPESEGLKELLEGLRAVKGKDNVLRKWLKDLFGSEEIAGFELQHVVQVLQAHLRNAQEGVIDTSEYERHLLEAEPEDNSPLISQAIQEFLDEKQAKDIKEHTLQEYSSLYGLLMEYIGDIKLSQLSYDHIRNFKALALKLPTSMRTRPDLKGMNVHQIVKMKLDYPTLSVTTVDKYLSRISQFLNFCKSHGYVTTNFAEGMKIGSKGKKPYEQKQPFSGSDILKIFNPDVFLNSVKDRPYLYWVPLIGVTTGMRLTEICQLFVSDIRKDDESDLWYISIEEAEEDNSKSVKNISSWRNIPIHPKLVDLGFLSYVESVRLEGETRLFPEMTSYKGKYGRQVSRWFNHVYKRKLSISNVDKKDFHSFRRYVMNHLKQKGVPEGIREDLAGHTSRSQQETYTEKFGIKVMMEEGVMKINPELDWTRLKKEWKNA